MGFDVIVKNGRVVLEDGVKNTDIGIKGEKIVKIQKGLSDPNAKIIDAKNSYVIPGGIDVHVHFVLPFCGTVSKDDFFTGGRAALHGGVTTVIDFAGQGQYDNLWQGIEEKMRIAEKNAACDYSFHIMVTGPKKIKDLDYEFKRLVDNGITSIKMFMIYESEGWQSDDADILKALETAKKYGITVMLHAESDKLIKYYINKYYPNGTKVNDAYGHAKTRPHVTEGEATSRAIRLAQAAESTLYIVHISAGETADHLKRAHEAGVLAFGETCPQYLVLDDSVFKKENGHFYGTCPQIKKKSDSKRLWKALKDGDLICVSTDTCTFDSKQKAMWEGDFTKIPFGLPGVETMIPVVYTYGVKKGVFSITHFAKLISTNPAKFFGLYPQKGTIKVGSDADIAVLDDKQTTVKASELYTNCDFSPYEGFKLSGFAKYTLLRGKVVIEDGKYTGKEKDGKFIKRKPYGYKLLDKPFKVQPKKYIYA